MPAFLRAFFYRNRNASLRSPGSSSRRLRTQAGRRTGDVGIVRHLVGLVGSSGRLRAFHEKGHNQHRRRLLIEVEYIMDIAPPLKSARTRLDGTFPDLD
jgi:hypothetical protein